MPKRPMYDRIPRRWQMPLAILLGVVLSQVIVWGTEAAYTGDDTHDTFKPPPPGPIGPDWWY